MDGVNLGIRGESSRVIFIYDFFSICVKSNIDIFAINWYNKKMLEHFVTSRDLAVKGDRATVHVGDCFSR